MERGLHHRELVDTTGLGVSLVPRDAPGGEAIGHALLIDVFPSGWFRLGAVSCHPCPS
jgi:hypothetical protein